MVNDRKNILRPLLLHMANSKAAWGTAPVAATAFQKGFLPWNPSLEQEASALKDLMNNHENSDELWQHFHKMVALKSELRSAELLKGVNAYMDHPYVRPESDAMHIHLAGSTKLLDFGYSDSSDEDAIPILLIPSLINPCYILDLMPGRSMAEYFRANGYRPYLIDWGIPSEDEKDFTSSNYISERLLLALAYLNEVAGGPVPVMGYCLGGTLAMGLAAIAQDMISQLLLLAVPWDMQADPDHPTVQRLKSLEPMINLLPDESSVSVDALQMFFASLDPTLNDRKFRRFAAMDMQSEAAHFFVAMESWTNGGAPLVAGIAKESMRDWYQRNVLATGQWQVAGVSVDPSKITIPCFVVCPSADRIVPPKSALSLGGQLPNATIYDPGAGHVGMVVGSKAEEGLFKPMIEWLTAKRGAASNAT